MKNILKNIIFLTTAILFFSCSDEFINEKLDISGVATSAVIISPEWETDDYQFQCEGAGNVDFIVESKPEWLNLEANSGKFVNSTATIRGKANTDSHFSSTGIYIDQMVVKSGGKKYAVPVYYITEGDPAIQVNRTFELNYNSYNQLQITNTGNGILIWDIVSMPDWLTVNMEQFNAMSVLLGKNASAIVPFILNGKKAVLSDNLSGNINIATNDKNNQMISVEVKANLGIPSIYCNEEWVSFGNSESTKSFGIWNNGNGILVWHFEDLPEWLSISPSSGMFIPYESFGDIVFTCDRSKLKPGLNSAVIQLKSNAPERQSLSITVTARTPGSNINIRSLNGNIVDATFDKKTNTMYYVSGQPNKLIAYDVVSRTVLYEIALSKAPTCLAISEDFTKASIGHAGMISAVDLKTQSVIRTINYNYSIYDMEWTNDDWFCYTKAGTYMNNLYWINTSTLETAESDDKEMDEGTYLKKIPTQPYVIAARKFSSPSGITVFDIDTKLEKNYRHQNINNYWFTSDGKYMFESKGDVYNTEAITFPTGRNPGDIAPFGKLQIHNTGLFDVVNWIDYSIVSKAIWALSKSSAIYKFEDNDYTLVKSYLYDDLYQPDGQTTPYEVEAHYLFANNEETELSVLRKGKDNNNWSIEFIPVQ